MICITRAVLLRGNSAALGLNTVLCSFDIALSTSLSSRDSPRIASGEGAEERQGVTKTLEVLSTRTVANYSHELL